jgi:hypothetical protein
LIRTSICKILQYFAIFLHVAELLQAPPIYPASIIASAKERAASGCGDGASVFLAQGSCGTRIGLVGDMRLPPKPIDQHCLFVPVGLTVTRVFKI